MLLFSYNREYFWRVVVSRQSVKLRTTDYFRLTESMGKIDMHFKYYVVNTFLADGPDRQTILLAMLKAPSGKD